MHWPSVLTSDNRCEEVAHGTVELQCAEGMQLGHDVAFFTITEPSTTCYVIKKKILSFARSWDDTLWHGCLLR